MKAPVLQTERLTLRPFVPEDAEELWSVVMRDATVMHTLSVQPETEAEERAAAVRYIDSYATPWAPEGYGGWAVCARDDNLGTSGEMLGFCGFEVGQIDGEGAELGYGYGRSTWGRGVGMEAALRATAWYFEDGQFDRFYACYHPGNEGSRKILEAVGLVYSRDLDLWDSVANGLGKLPVLTQERSAWLART
jgi:RimJ/RimL family protein N-acetyltransferase